MRWGQQFGPDPEEGGLRLNHNEAQSRPLSFLINNGGTGFGDFGLDQRFMVGQISLSLLRQPQRVHLHHRSGSALLHWKMQPQRLSQIGTVEINMNQLKEWGWFILDCRGLDHEMSFVGHFVWVMLGFAGVCLVDHAVWVLRPWELILILSSHVV